MILGAGLLDQVLAWLGSLWSGHTPNPQHPQEKGALGIITPTGVTNDAKAAPEESDRGAMIDPNG